MTTIYIKPVKKATIIRKKDVTIKDVAELQGPKKIIDEVYSLIIMTIPEDKSKNYLISVLDIIKVIQRYNERVVIYNLGEVDIIINFLKDKKRENKVLTLLKVIFVGAVLTSGSAVAIMAFHTDTQLPKVFTNFYFLLLGNNDYQPYLVEIPYAIGLAIGISVFFNHFSKIKFTSDPTPIEVELKLYENQVDDSIIEVLKEEKEGDSS